MGNSIMARRAGFLSILQGLLLFIPLAVFAGAVNWPSDSLRYIRANGE